VKTGLRDGGPAASAIVQLLDDSPDAADEAARLARARAFSEPLLDGQQLDTGEDALVHADAVAAILQGIGASPAMRAAAYLVYAGDYLNKPEEVVAKAFGPSYASLVANTRKLVQLQRAAREAQLGAEQRVQQTERVRKMLLAFSRDLRVVLLRLASRLPASCHARRRWRPSPCKCSHRWRTDSASGRSSGNSKTCRSAFSSPSSTSVSRGCSTNGASSASSVSRPSASAWPTT
jgi:GTP pyrophosphokinase